MHDETYECCACGECFIVQDPPAEGEPAPECPFCGGHITFKRIIAISDDIEPFTFVALKGGCHAPVEGHFT